MSFATTRELDLLARCLAPPQEAEAAHLAAAAQQVSDWSHLYQYAHERLVAPLLYARLRHANLLEVVPPEIRNRFQWIYEQTAALNALRLHQILKVSTPLVEQGVRTLYFKGTSLILTGDYPDPGHRMFADVDLLAKEADKENLRQAFAQAGGWWELPVPGRQAVKDTKWVNAWRTLIEVHWHLKSYNGVPGQVAEDRLWSSAQPLNYRGKIAWVPAPEDRFIMAAVHSTVQHAFDSSLLLVALADLAHIAGKNRGSFDWDRMAQALERERMLEHVTVATQLAWEVTRFPPLQEGLAAFWRRQPGLETITTPLVRPLLRMIRKPWVFASLAESRFLTAPPWRQRIQVLVSTVFSKLFPHSWKGTPFMEKGAEVEVIKMNTTPQRRFFDLDFLSYIIQLNRFYRRIGYTGLNGKVHD